MVIGMKSRVLRSTSSASAPAGRVKDAATRKDYSHNSVTSAFQAGKAHASSVSERFHRVMAWSNTRKVPLINCVIIVIFMVVTLLSSLMLRTQMAEISFEQTAVQSRIARLRQDVETTQAKLDTLEAGLPAKAQEMGMVPQQGSIAIDLSDYAAKRKNGEAERKKADRHDEKQQSSQQSSQSSQSSQSNQSQQSQQNQQSNQNNQNQQQSAIQEKH